jgi:energy-coupling factor transport system substrate-specific component
METGKLLVKCAVFIALAAVIKIVLASVPNIELLTFWIAVVTIVYGLKMGILVAFMGNTVADLYVGFGPWTVFISTGFVVVAMLFWLFRYYLRTSIRYAGMAIMCTVGFDVFTIITSMCLLFGYSVKMALIQQYGLFIPPAYYPFGWVHLGSNALIFYFLAQPIIGKLMHIEQGIPHSP